MNSKIVILALIVALAVGINAGELSGCHKGYCWTSCRAAGFLVLSDKEWCYTTKGRSQDRNYVSCSGDGDCNGDWKCAGPCSL